jgi:hypothetical protein
MSKTDENKIGPLNETDWAWELPQIGDLKMAGTLLQDIMKKAGQEDKAWQFCAKRCAQFDVKPSPRGCTKTNSPTDVTTVSETITNDFGNWEIKLVPTQDFTIEQEKFKPNKVPRILIQTPVDIDLENNKPGEYVPTADEFTAAEFAKVVAIALNTYLKLAREWKSERIKKKAEPEPFLCSWDFVQNKIVPALRKQFQADAEKLMQRARQENSEAEALRKEQEKALEAAEQAKEAAQRKLETAERSRLDYDPKIVVKLLNCLGNIAYATANQVSRSV